MRRITRLAEALLGLMLAVGLIAGLPLLFKATLTPLPVREPAPDAPGTLLAAC
jgi:hypothetical protein